MGMEGGRGRAGERNETIVDYRKEEGVRAGAEGENGTLESKVGEGGKARERGTRRRKWTKELDYILLQEIAATGAHVPSYGEMKPLYDRVASNLNKLSAFHFKTDWKHSSDRAKRLMRQFKAEDTGRARVSGEEEEVDDMSVLLADLIEEADDHAVVVSERREAEAARYRKLEEDGAAIRAAAMGRMRGNEGNIGEKGEDREAPAEEEEGDAGEGSARPSKRRKGNAAGMESLEDAITFRRIEELESKKREVELKRLELEGRKFERECEERDRGRKERQERLELEKKEKLAFINLLTTMSKKD